MANLDLGEELNISSTTALNAAPTKLPMKFIRYHLVPIAIYLVGAVVFSWPLVLHFTDQVIRTGSGDVWAHLWNIWWARFSLLNLHTGPFYTNELYWPQGASLYFHALNPFTGYLSIPLQLVFGLVPAFNIMALFEVTLAGYAAMQLSLYLTNNLAGAVIAGVIYAFSPLESLYLNLGQLELMSIGWLPLFMLFFIKFLRRESSFRRNAALSVVFLLIISLVTWYYALYALIFVGLYTLYLLFEQRRKWQSRAWLKIIFSVTALLLSYLVLISPILLPTLKESGSGSTQAKQSLFNLVYNSADLKSLFWPEPTVLWGIFGAKFSQDYQSGTFIGYGVLVLAGVGLLVQPKRGWFWAGVVLIFAILALGPVLRLNFDYNLKPVQSEQGLPLPERLLYSLPFGSIARVPLRFLLMTQLSLAILSAFGVAHLQKFCQSFRWSRTLLGLVLGGVGFLVFIEFLPIPRTLQETAVPSFYTQIKDEAAWNDFALLEVPDQATPISEYYQTVHEHPIVGGYLSRKENYPYDDNTPGWYELRQLDFKIRETDIISRDSLRNTPLVLAYYKIRYVVVHKDELMKNTQAVIAAVFGDTKPYYQDEQITVYRLPLELPLGKSDTSSQLVIDLGSGWEAPDISSNNTVSRLMNGAAQLQVFNPSALPLTATLTVEVMSKDKPGLLILQQLDTAMGLPHSLGESNITSQPTSLTFTINLKSGPNLLTFQSNPDDKATFAFSSINIK